MGVPLQHTTLSIGVLSMFLHEQLGKVKEKVPTSKLDPVVEVIKENVPAIFMIETLGRTIATGFFRIYGVLADDKFKCSMNEARKKLTEKKEEKRMKLLEEIKKERIEYTAIMAKIIKETDEIEKIPEVSPLNSKS